MDQIEKAKWNFPSKTLSDFVIGKIDGFFDSNGVIQFGSEWVKKYIDLIQQQGTTPPQL